LDIIFGRFLSKYIWPNTTCITQEMHHAVEAITMTGQSSFSPNIRVVLSQKYIITKWNIKVIIPMMGFVEIAKDTSPSNTTIK
jgi:hypothetical protein